MSTGNSITDRLWTIGLPVTLGDPTGEDGGATTPTASDSDQPSPDGDAAGAGGDGGGDGGSQPDADAFASERERLNQTIRDLQSQRDRAEARLKAAAQTTETTSAGGLTTPEQIRAEMIRATEIANLSVQLRNEDSTKLADPGIFARAYEYESPEAFRAAVESSHRERQAWLDSLGVIPKSEAEAELARLKAAAGELNSTPTSTDTGPATGDPTPEQLAAMSFDEYRQVPQDVIDRVTRSANQ